MEEQIIIPTKEELVVKGKLAYSESFGAWNTIRLKKEVLNKFKTLKEKRSSFSYKLAFYDEGEQLEKAIRKLRKENAPMPVLMWFVKEKV